MYRTNDEGESRYEYVSKNVTQILVFSPIFFTFLIVIEYFSIGTKSILFFYSMLAFMLFYIALVFYSTFRQLNRQNRTISEVSFSNEDVIIKTDKILWLKAKEYKIKKSMIHIKNRRFDWYDKNTYKVGASIFVIDKELYLVKDYFDDYDNILNIFS